MPDGFGDLGLRPELVEGVELLGYDAPTPLQRAAVPVLRRGGNVVLNASAGAGVVGAYGLALVDRLLGEEPMVEEEAGALRALVLVPTPEVAVRTAASLARYARGTPLAVAALAPGWATPVRDAAVVVATPAAALDAVHASALKLGGVAALVIDDLAAIFALDAHEAVEALTNSTPREAQRVVATSERTDAVDDYVERHVRRALQIPPIPTEVEEEPTPPVETRPLDYAIVVGGDKTAALAGFLAGREAPGEVAVYCRTGARAQMLADELILRGFRAARGTGDDVRIVVLAPDEAAPEGAFVLSYDVPFDADDLSLRHGGGGLVLIEPRERPHLRQIAARANFEPRARRLPVGAPAAAELESFRAMLERALYEEDIAAQLLVLQPLFERYAPAEVAAAASALLRRRPPAPAEALPEAVEAPEAPRARAAVPAPPAYVRLFFGVGARDGVRPGDLVGAITGEANISGEKVGKIDIRDNLSIVEVDSAVADRVIRAVNGTTLKGRSVRVDYDRRPPMGERPRRRLREPGR